MTSNADAAVAAARHTRWASSASPMRGSFRAAVRLETTAAAAAAADLSLIHI